MPGLTKEQKAKREAIKKQHEEAIEKHAEELIARFKRGDKFEALYEELQVESNDIKRQQDILDQMQSDLDKKRLNLWHKQDALMQLENSGAFKDESK